MALDLFGKPVGGHPPYTLSLHQKRQATLLYYWMSMGYLKGLLAMIDALIQDAGTDLDKAKLQGRDAVLTNERWGVRDTSANWSTHVFPALEEFRQTTLADIAARTSEDFGRTGTNQCRRMISEHSSLWMTAEEEAQFKAQWDKVDDHGSMIDDAAGAGGQRRMEDTRMVVEWHRNAHLFERLPLLRVRTDVVAETGKLPPRTGVYVAQDDPDATLQFAWTGNKNGILGVSQTYTDTGRRLVKAMGRRDFWVDRDRMTAFTISEMQANPKLDTGGITLEDIRRNPRRAFQAIDHAAFTTRPCKWYYVEKIDGEFDDEVEAPRTTDRSGLRCEAGQLCPRTGWWITPSGAGTAGGRQHFTAGTVMPSLGNPGWVTIWQFDDNQSNEA